MTNWLDSKDVNNSKLDLINKEEWWFLDDIKWIFKKNGRDNEKKDIEVSDKELTKYENSLKDFDFRLIKFWNQDYETNKNNDELLNNINLRV